MEYDTIPLLANAVKYDTMMKNIASFVMFLKQENRKGKEGENDMKIIEPDFEFMEEIDGENIIKKIEKAGRVCYKSEQNISDTSAEKFIRNIIARGHESVLEHGSISVKIICDRGVTHEIVRHRLASYSQESTRYCNYSSDKFGNEITVIKPCFWEEDSREYAIWKESMEQIEKIIWRFWLLGQSRNRQGRFYRIA